MLTAFRNANPWAETPLTMWRLAAAMRLVGWLPFLVVWFTACAPPSQVRPPAELMAVTVGPEEDLEELARRHLGETARAWIIKDFNQLESVSEGQVVLIPRRSYRPGGLAPHGYQMIPVLAYPDLAAVKSDQTSLIVDRFRRQIQFLRTEGYHVVGGRELAAFMAFKATLPPKAVVLTFDDQSRLFYDLIFPILRTYKLPGTLFVSPQAVGTETMANWSQLREMTESGISIQYRFPKKLAGSLKPSSFPDRSGLAKIVTILARDRERIESGINQACSYLAYPDGKEASLMIMLAAKAGFEGGFNRLGGSNPFYRSQFAIQREPVKWGENIESYRKHFDVFKEEALR